eukprot:g406.t1
MSEKKRYGRLEATDSEVTVMILKYLKISSENTNNEREEKSHNDQARIRDMERYKKFEKSMDQLMDSSVKRDFSLRRDRNRRARPHSAQPASRNRNRNKLSSLKTKSDTVSSSFSNSVPKRKKIRPQSAKPLRTSGALVLGKSNRSGKGSHGEETKREDGEDASFRLRPSTSSKALNQSITRFRRAIRKSEKSSFMKRKLRTKSRSEARRKLHRVHKYMVTVNKEKYDIHNNQLYSSQTLLHGHQNNMNSSTSLKGEEASTDGVAPWTHEVDDFDSISTAMNDTSSPQRITRTARTHRSPMANHRNERRRRRRKSPGKHRKRKDIRSKKAGIEENNGSSFTSHFPVNLPHQPVSPNLIPSFNSSATNEYQQQMKREGGDSLNNNEEIDGMTEDDKKRIVKVPGIRMENQIESAVYFQNFGFRARPLSASRRIRLTGGGSTMS